MITCILRIASPTKIMKNFQKRFIPRQKGSFQTLSHTRKHPRLGFTPSLNALWSRAGFTLIEILIVIGLIAVLATIALIALNPARHFAQGRNAQRTAHIHVILNAIGQNIADNKGTFTCASAIPTTLTDIKKDGVDLRQCLVPIYIAEIPIDPDPLLGSNNCESSTACVTGSYDTGYEVMKDSTIGRITVKAPGAELGKTISATR